MHAAHSLAPARLACPAPISLALAAAGLAALQLALWFALPSLPWLDMPNHAARAHVIGDLLFGGGARFGQVFTLRIGWEPYLLGDLLLAAMTRVMPTDLAARMLMALAFLAPPLATLHYLRVRGAGALACTLAVLAALFLATDWTFTLGFANYRLCLPLVLLALASAERFVAAPGPGNYSAFAAWAAAGFLMHLAAPVLLGLALAGLLLARWPTSTQGLARFAALGALPVALVLQYVLTGPADPAPYTWAPLLEKLQVAKGWFQRFDHDWDKFLTLLFALAVAIPALFGLARLRERGLARDAAAIALLSVLAYVALPSARGEVVGIDIRVLPLALCFASIAAFAALDDPRTLARLPSAARLLGGPATWSAALLLALVSINGVYLARWLQPLDARIGEVRAVLAALPPGARVLSIVTLEGWRGTLLHAGEFVTVDRDAVTPYVFSGDQGYPQAYFRYRHRPYAPSQWSYTRQQPIDWPRVRAGWPWLLVIGQAPRLRIPFATRTVAASGSATLLRVVPAQRAPARKSRRRAYAALHAASRPEGAATRAGRSTPLPTPTPRRAP